MGLNAEKRLTECDIAGNVQDGVGGEIVELKTVEITESPEKGMNWESQTAKEMGKEDDALTGAGFWDPDRSRGALRSLDHRRMGGSHLGRQQVSGTLKRTNVILGDDRGPL